LITNSKNKIKTTWNIVKSITGKNLENKLPLSVCINGALTENQQVIADSFQSHFLSIDDKLVSNNIEDINDINCKDYLHRIFKNP
jgi:predicted nuclease of restriction endonuclease-like (RecB) superfamily